MAVEYRAPTGDPTGSGGRSGLRREPRSVVGRADAEPIRFQCDPALETGGIGPQPRQSGRPATPDIPVEFRVRCPARLQHSALPGFPYGTHGGANAAAVPGVYRYRSNLESVGEHLVRRVAIQGDQAIIQGFGLRGYLHLVQESGVGCRRKQ